MVAGLRAASLKGSVGLGFRGLGFGVSGPYRAPSVYNSFEKAPFKASHNFF